MRLGVGKRVVCSELWLLKTCVFVTCFLHVLFVFTGFSHALHQHYTVIHAFCTCLAHAYVGSFFLPGAYKYFGAK